MITLIGLKSHLLDRAELLLSQDLHFLGVDDFWCDGRVDTCCLNGKDEVASVLDEHGCVHAENTGLIWLSNISENHVAHRHQHSVLLGVSSILNNGDDIGSLFSHVDEVTADSL